MSIYKIKSFAKLNLGLKILNKRLDHYHNINSIFIAINLHDIMEFMPARTFSIKCSNPDVPLNKTNTIYKAYNILNKKYKFKHQYEIVLHKLIPIKSGLGGGSSNAACTLKTLNKLCKLNLSHHELLDLGLKVGSDVPFFIEGGIKLIKGRGEIIKKHTASILESLFFLLVFPNFSISTKWAYNKLKKTLEYGVDSTKFPALDGNVDWKLFENDFEKVVGSTYPEMYEIKESLTNNGALYSSLSGSGSTMFGVYNNKQFIKIAQNKLKNYNTLIAYPA